MTYLCLRMVLFVKKRINIRRLAREKIEREIQFTLPTKDNSFIRARLNTVLQSPTINDSQTTEISKIKFSYANELLKKLEIAKLSTADGLQAQSLTETIRACAGKTSCTANDLRSLNEAFSTLLKLSAKYAI